MNYLFFTSLVESIRGFCAPSRNAIGPEPPDPPPLDEHVEIVEVEKNPEYDTGLLEIPEEVVSRIFEYLDFEDIIALRKTCRGFFHFTNSNLNLTHLNIWANNISMVIVINEIIKVTYEFHPDGCYLVKKHFRIREKQRRCIVKGLNFMDCFLTDLAFLIKGQNSKTLENLELKWQHYESPRRGIHKILDCIEESLKSRKSPLKVEVLSMNAQNQDQVMQILPYLNPKSLRFLRINDTGRRREAKFEMDKIFELEHWNRLKIIYIEHYIGGEDLKHFAHVRTGYVHITFLNMEVYKAMLEFPSCNPRFEKLIIFFTTRPNVGELRSALKEDQAPESKKERFIQVQLRYGRAFIMSRQCYEKEKNDSDAYDSETDSDGD